MAAAAAGGVDKCDDDIARMLEGDLRPIVQLLSRYLPEYRMSLLTTKCLNTAIMVMYLALGDSALGVARLCDVEPVRARRRQRRYDDAYIAGILKDRVLDRRAEGRWLHYVMLTDGDMTLASPTIVGSTAASTVYFPGHVFVIESFPDPAGPRRFRFYQSYINHYDVVQHTDMMRGANGASDKPDIRREDVERMLDGLIDLAKAPEWNDRSAEFWSWFARVPMAHASQFLGYRRAGVVLMCHRHVRVGSCAQALRKLAARALEDTRSMMHDPDAVWGDASLYDPANGAKPLTVKEMLAVLRTWVGVGGSAP